MLLILSTPKHHPWLFYRGTDRFEANYDPCLPDDHPFNRVFFRWLELTADFAVPLELEQARELTAAFNEHAPAERFELVDVVEPGQPHAAGMQCLGYDLSDGGFSLIGWGLALSRQPPPDHDPADPIWIIQPLLRLIQAYFQPLLNVYGLFDDLQTAQLCLDSMLALQRVVPNLWENETVSFQVYGIWVIPVV